MMRLRTMGGALAVFDQQGLNRREDPLHYGTCATLTPNKVTMHYIKTMSDDP